MTHTIKHLLIVSICILSLSVTSQNNNEIRTQFNYYAEIRLNTNNYLLNDVISKYDIEINKEIYTPAQIGFQFHWDDFSAELGLGISLSNAEKNNYGYKYVGMPTFLQFKYELLENTYLGISLDYEPVALSLYSKNDGINIDSSLNSSFVQLNNQFITAGVIISYHLFAEEEVSFIFSIGYNYVLKAYLWESQYDNTFIPIEENGVHYMYVKVGIPISRSN